MEQKKATLTFMSISSLDVAAEEEKVTVQHFQDLNQPMSFAWKVDKKLCDSANCYSHVL